MKAIDLTGQKFNRWTVASLDRRERKDSWYLCECECGTQRVLSAQSVKRGLSKSCGCLAIDTKVHQTHGERVNGTTSPEYKAWRSMKYRCYVPTCKAFKWYGGRGIKVCERWLNSFENFLADMGRRPTSKHSLDRYPDKNGNYEPGNCRWATQKEQSNNLTSNVEVSINGEIMNCAQAADKYGINRTTFHDRLKSGMTAIEAVSTPINISKRNKKLTTCQQK